LEKAFEINATSGQRIIKNMIEFQPATVEEQMNYEGEFDRVMSWTEESELQAMKLAARARYQYRQRTGLVPLPFDNGVLTLPTQLRSMMMNASFVADYSNLLNHYAEIGYLHVSNDEGLSVDETRDRASRMAKEIEIGSIVLDVVAQTDFDEFLMDVAEQDKQ
jgi:hypothetical protein